MNGPFTDIGSVGWIDRAVPRALHPYARLMRLDRPIGTWLLLIPCWWSTALAADGFPNLWFMLLFGLGAIIMRGAGCILNDIYDRDFDGRVERTRGRPLPSGQVSLGQAIAFMIFLSLLGLLILLQFNAYTVWLGVGSLLLIVTYPAMKRFTWWPQFFLGITFNWGALMGWAAVRGQIDMPSVVLYIAGIFWTLAYDTIYAHQDKDDDALVGIKSSARLLGEKSPPYVAAFFAIGWILIVLSGYLAGMGLLFYVGALAGAAQIVWQMRGWDLNDPANCLRRFRSNRDFGLIILLGIIAGNLW